MQIGPHTLETPLIVAPMAGVTDRPFRELCLRLGAGMAVSEMLLANPDVWDTQKTRMRMDHSAEGGLRSVQIAGADPEMMAFAARYNVEQGAQIVDINMGCPAKKVNKKLAGSALLRQPDLVRTICRAVVDAVEVPVTLKIRTGWDPDNRNGEEIARIAEDCGIAALAVHGRTRTDLYRGEAEYDTIRAIKQAVSIPVVANGDIDSPEKARYVLDYTGVDAVMIGRAAQGRPWIFREIRHFLETGTKLPPPEREEVRTLMNEHVTNLHQFYGAYLGARIARKHVGWYLDEEETGREFRKHFNALDCADAQLEALEAYFDGLG
ncbi:tRNA-dihydrouridine synthase B [Aeromonas hydrophila]|uniref:tRNA-dihydrouridine synthase B n=2 Tax=Aeromonas hydrophila TaxID=644 RepID=A0KNY3_AERHH|nr:MULTISPECIES: tRNA dihydrouridine synthase DusB [Aeromonas]ABK37576.1 tRNA-dihydrouridine synthase B [Aeromonas hydrophila subsp. hydrophila ATCC 7966]AGM45487.1 tRNA-dihydrouridine synthase B [Aeromonas hydrophila ML09-119]AHX34106.1 tRNA-dihydrouridine synthase B [Aeromonas hydrophila subsp. hydrophila AL09-71]AHX70907.1 tRNA-dihydrouridine synthase B [Aeromonas hydrophila pc104A]AJE35113.1 tRNA-dihydrouridine synthase B [Aeromonas hydrophila J-1]